MLKVYLDTNIIIHGSDYDGCTELRKLAKEKKVEFYLSPELLTEQKTLSRKHRQENLKSAELLYRLTNDPNASENLKKQIDKSEEIKKQESDEWEIWKDTPIKLAGSTFGGLMALAQFGSERELLANDYAKEIPRLGELTEVHGLKPMDAIHVMHAYSAGMNCLLTEDTDLIKKVKRVPWLSHVRFLKINELIS